MWMPQTPEPEQDMLDGTPGSINVSSILTGKLVAKVSAVAKPRTFCERKVSDALTGACKTPMTFPPHAASACMLNSPKTCQVKCDTPQHVVQHSNLAIVVLHEHGRLFGMLLLT